jgi:hypothetical protein
VVVVRAVNLVPRISPLRGSAENDRRNVVEIEPHHGTEGLRADLVMRIDVASGTGSWVHGQLGN